MGRDPQANSPNFAPTSTARPLRDDNPSCCGLDHASETGEAGVSIPDLALATMLAKAIDPGDETMRRDFIRRFHWAMGRLQRHAGLSESGIGKGVSRRARGVWIAPIWRRTVEGRNDGTQNTALL